MGRPPLRLEHKGRSAPRAIAVRTAQTLLTGRGATARRRD